MHCAEVVSGNTTVVKGVCARIARTRGGAFALFVECHEESLEGISVGTTKRKHECSFCIYFCSLHFPTYPPAFLHCKMYADLSRAAEIKRNQKRECKHKTCCMHTALLWCNRRHVQYFEYSTCRSAPIDAFQLQTTTQLQNARVKRLRCHACPMCSGQMLDNERQGERHVF